MNNKKKYIVIVSILVLILIGVFLFLNFNSKENLPTFQEVKNIKVTLNVLDKKYETNIKENSSVFKVMQKLKEESRPPDLFDFKYKEHTGLGAFITEINGKSGGEDGYWIYYINEVEANVGVSDYKINNGDIISWKYEK